MGSEMCIRDRSGRSLDILHLFSLAVRSVYKELHADYETGAADNK